MELEYHVVKGYEFKFRYFINLDRLMEAIRDDEELNSKLKWLRYNYARIMFPEEMKLENPDMIIREIYKLKASTMEKVERIFSKYDRIRTSIRNGNAEDLEEMKSYLEDEYRKFLVMEEIYRKREHEKYVKMLIAAEESLSIENNMCN